MSNKADFYRCVFCLYDFHFYQVAGDICPLCGERVIVCPPHLVTPSVMVELAKIEVPTREPVPQAVIMEWVAREPHFSPPVEAKS